MGAPARGAAGGRHCSRGLKPAFVKPVSPPDADASAAVKAGNPAAEAKGPLLAALQPGRAVLVDGTRLVKGLPGFGRNALPALLGEYAYLQAGQKPAPGEKDGILRISVWFTREPLVYPDGWTTPAEGLETCSTLPAGSSIVGSLRLDESTTLWALGATGYTVFVGIPDAMTDPCRFTGIFVERFEFFRRYAERPEDTSFPAILDISL